ncbi:MAG: hypothetical protein ACRERD_18810 [Candidatus Binatia bacterium]
MVICFDCDPKTKSALDQLLRSDQFRDYSEIIVTAVLNLVVLHRQMANCSPLLIPDPRFSGTLSDRGASRPNVRATDELQHEKRSSKADAPDRLPDNFLTGIPEIFRLEHLPKPRAVAAKTPPDKSKRGKKIRLENWIFGQYNTVLPAKASTRALGHLIGSNAKGVPLVKAAQTIAREAALLGDYLAAHDLKHNVPRDEAIRTGFPRTTVNAASERVVNAGQLRFASQFVGAANGKGHVSGLLADFKFLNWETSDDFVQLTDAGWHFAVLRNPVLDGFPDVPGQKFTEDEVRFLLDHIYKHIPIEDFAYRTLLTAIRNGANTPQKLNESLQDMDLWWRDRGPRETPSFLSSQRSGAVSRMADLGLVQRRREGTRVLYLLTASGNEYLNRVA